MAKDYEFMFQKEDGTTCGTIKVGANNVQDAARVANMHKKQLFKDDFKEIKTVLLKKKKEV